MARVRAPSEVRLQPLFTAQADDHLRRVLCQRPLLAFDFDGTLAPIVSRPGAARVPAATGRRLRTLAEQLPVAVISGRSIADVSWRLGFKPWQIVGSHGAEVLDDPATARLSTTLDSARRRLETSAALLRRAAVTVEDKGASIALHYRRSPDHELALNTIAKVLDGLGSEIHVGGGKMVVNLTAAMANDKAKALRTLVRLAGAGAAVFVGDDRNDEPVFSAGEPDWLTVCVGRELANSQAQYLLDSTADMPRLLERLLSVWRSIGG